MVLFVLWDVSERAVGLDNRVFANDGPSCQRRVRIQYRARVQRNFCQGVRIGNKEGLESQTWSDDAKGANQSGRVNGGLYDVSPLEVSFEAGRTTFSCTTAVG